MALFQCKLFSQALFRSVNVNVVLPTPDSNNCFFESDVRLPRPGEKYQTLWLLHGVSADESDWQRFSSIERYAQAKQLAVVMPDGYNSMYEDNPCGGSYHTYIAQELPEMLRALLPLSGRREDNFIAGLSMGGGGAFKIALRNPRSYGAAASLSGGLGTDDLKNTPAAAMPHIAPWHRQVYGPNMEYFDPDKHDLRRILKRQVEAGETLPRLYQCCGTEDFLYEGNTAFRDYALGLGVDLTFEEGPGVHNFDFWDPFIRRVLDWLPLAGGLVKE